jgi:hypothetical protein
MADHDAFVTSDHDDIVSKREQLWERARIRVYTPDEAVQAIAPNSPDPAAADLCHSAACRASDASPVRAATRLGSTCRVHLAYSSLAANGAARLCADGIV